MRGPRGGLAGARRPSGKRGGGHAAEGGRGAELIKACGRRGWSAPPSRRPAVLGLREPPEPRAALRRWAGLAPERARRAPGRGGAEAGEAGGGGRGGARVAAAQPGVLAAGRGTCDEQPCAPCPLSAAAAQRPPAGPPGPPGMERHVLGAVVYWLLLPFALLAGEWARGLWAGRGLRPRSPARTPAEETPRDARPAAPAFQKHERAGGGREGGGGVGVRWHPGALGCGQASLRRAAGASAGTRGSRGARGAALLAGQGWNAEEGGTNLFRSSVLKKKKLQTCIMTS